MNIRDMDTHPHTTPRRCDCCGNTVNHNTYTNPLENRYYAGLNYPPMNDNQMKIFNRIRNHGCPKSMAEELFIQNYRLLNENHEYMKKLYEMEKMLETMQSAIGLLKKYDPHGTIKKRDLGM